MASASASVHPPAAADRSAATVGRPCALLSLPALPLPRRGLDSLGCSRRPQRRRAAHSTATPLPDGAHHGGQVVLAEHRSTATTSGRSRSSHPRARSPAAPGGRRGTHRPGCGPYRRRRGAAAVRARPRPLRARSGSGRGRRRARARPASCSLQPLEVRTRVRDATRPQRGGAGGRAVSRPSP